MLYVSSFLWIRDGGESGGKMNPFAEQEAWEEHQIGKLAYQENSEA